MNKIELHVHLDGSVREKTAYELGHITKEEIHAKEKCKDLNDYLTKFDKVNDIMQTKENLERIAYELAYDLKRENVIYAEIRFAPLKHLKKGLTMEEVVQSVLNGLKKVNIKTNLILCLMRGESFQNNLNTIKVALKFLNKGVCAIDLAGAEAIYKTENYKELFLIAKDNNIPFTIHAGEADGKESIYSAINFGASRIGHGIRCLEDDNLVKEIINRKIVLEICPTSNVQTNVVDKYEKHPIYELYKKGVLVTINTDNRTVSNITLKEEYNKLKKAFNFTEKDFKQMNINAIKGAFITDNEKIELLKKMN